MTIYKIHADVNNCQSLTLDIEDFLDLLDPTIGEEVAMALGHKNLSIVDGWQPLELGYFHNEGTVDLADVSIWRTGLLLLNKKAHDAIAELLIPHGELLPCELHGEKSYLFNCLNLKPEDSATIDYNCHGDMFIDIKSMSIQTEECENIFKLKTDTNFELYISEGLVNTYQAAGLKGLVFSQNLASNTP